MNLSTVTYFPVRPFFHPGLMDPFRKRVSIPSVKYPVSRSPMADAMNIRIRALSILQFRMICHIDISMIKNAMGLANMKIGMTIRKKRGCWSRGIVYSSMSVRVV